MKTIIFLFDRFVHWFWQGFGKVSEVILAFKINENSVEKIDQDFDWFFDRCLSQNASKMPPKIDPENQIKG